MRQSNSHGSFPTYFRWAERAIIRQACLLAGRRGGGAQMVAKQSVQPAANLGSNKADFRYYQVQGVTVIRRRTELVFVPCDLTLPSWVLLSILMPFPPCTWPPRHSFMGLSVPNHAHLLDKSIIFVFRWWRRMFCLSLRGKIAGVLQQVARVLVALLGACDKLCLPLLSRAAWSVQHSFSMSEMTHGIYWCLPCAFTLGVLTSSCCERAHAPAAPEIRTCRGAVRRRSSAAAPLNALLISTEST